MRHFLAVLTGGTEDYPFTLLTVSSSFSSVGKGETEPSSHFRVLIVFLLFAGTYSKD